MGLLDDAIRDHLQLKRDHGADPGELARLEDEALGPPVRETQEALEATRVAQAVPAEPPAPAVQEPPVPAAVEPESAATPAGVEPAPAPPPPDPDTSPAGGPEPESPGEHTVAFDAEQAAGAGAPAPEGEDVLEETPDFLQETPEHDRLWFEQKPPRDFDFDG